MLIQSDSVIIQSLFSHYSVIVIVKVWIMSGLTDAERGDSRTNLFDFPESQISAVNGDCSADQKQDWQLYPVDAQSA